MGVQVTWYNTEKTVLLYKFSEQWQWDDYFAVNQKAYKMMTSVDHDICIIGDLTDSPSVPRNPLLNAAYAFTNHTHITCSIYVGLSPLIHNLLKLTLKLYPTAMKGQEVHFVTTMENANNILSEKRLATG